MASKRFRDKEDKPSTSAGQSDSKRSKREDSDNNIEKARQCYKDIVRSVSNSLLHKAWNDDQREDFLADINKVQNANDMLHTLREFEKLIDHNKTRGGIQWKTQYWIWMTNSDIIQDHTVTRFVVCLKFMEKHMLSQGSHSMGWTDERKDKWLKCCDDLIDPFHELALCDNMYLNTKALFIQFRFESHLDYDRTIDEVIASINIAVKELENASKKSWPEHAIDAISVIVGFFSGVFACIIKLTTNVGSKILEEHRIWDEELYQKVEGELEKISEVTMALAELLQHYRKAAIAAKEKLPGESNGGFEDLQKIGLLECKPCVGGTEPCTVEQLHKLLKIVRPDMRTTLLQNVAKSEGTGVVITGAKKLVGVVCSNNIEEVVIFIISTLQTMKGIYDMIASKPEVSAMEKMFRELMDNLKETRKIIFNRYDFPKNE